MLDENGLLPIISDQAHTTWHMHKQECPGILAHLCTSQGSEAASVQWSQQHWDSSPEMAAGVGVQEHVAHRRHLHYGRLPTCFDHLTRAAIGDEKKRSGGARSSFIALLFTMLLVLVVQAQQYS